MPRFFSLRGRMVLMGKGGKLHKILITGIGGPAGVSVAESLRRSGDSYYLIGVDCDPYSPGRFMADQFSTVPPAGDEGFIQAIMDASEDCEAIFCTVDEELPEVAGSLDKFECRALVPSFEAVSICLDKYETFKALKSANIQVPNTVTYKVGDKNILKALDFQSVLDSFNLKSLLEVFGFKYPLLLKPRRGRGSRDVFKIVNDGEYEAAGTITRNLEMIIQEYVEEPEYTIDVLVNEKGELVACVPRERLRIKNGLSTVARTVKDDRFPEISEKIAKTVGLRYIFNYQCRGPDLKVIEINPRPAGTLILSTMSGINMPKILIDGDLKPGSYLNKYIDDFWLYRNMNSYTGEKK